MQVSGARWGGVGRAERGQEASGHVPERRCSRRRSCRALVPCARPPGRGCTRAAPAAARFNALWRIGSGAQHACARGVAHVACPAACAHLPQVKKGLLRAPGRKRPRSWRPCWLACWCCARRRCWCHSWRRHCCYWRCCALWWWHRTHSRLRRCHCWRRGVRISVQPPLVAAPAALDPRRRILLAAVPAERRVRQESAPAANPTRGQRG